MNKFEVPAGLSFMLRDFTIAVLKQKPSNLYRFAADYFKRMADERSDETSTSVARSAEEAGSTAAQIGLQSHDQPSASSTATTSVAACSNDGLLAKKKVAMFVVVDNDAEACEPDPVSFQPKKKNHNSDTDDSRDDDSGDKHGGLHRNFGRRRSVAAERYDPEQDEEEDEDESSKKVTHPKTDEQRKRLKEAVQGILLFRSLEPEQINDVIDAMFERHVDPGDHVIRQGDDGDNFYVIDCGVYDVFFKSETSSAGSSSPTPTSTTTAAPAATASSASTSSVDRFVHRFEHSGSFGELALMYNQPRSASVLAVTKGRLWAMDRRSFRRIILRSAWRKRKAYEALLETVPMLQYLDPYERMNLADALSAVYFKEGDCIIKEGDPADGMYFIESGEVRVTITRNKEETEVSRMKAGSYFGEMALVEKVPRSASVYASSETVKLAFLEVDCFERLLGPCLEIMKRNITNYVKSS